jgi:hypothetical protein
VCSIKKIMKILAQLVLICAFLGCAEQDPQAFYSGTYHNSQKNGVILTLSSDKSFLLVDRSSGSGSGVWGIDISGPKKEMNLIFDAHNGKAMEEILVWRVTVEPNSDLTFSNGWRFYKVSD